MSDTPISEDTPDRDQPVKDHESLQESQGAEERERKMEFVARSFPDQNSEDVEERSVAEEGVVEKAMEQVVTTVPDESTTEAMHTVVPEMPTVEGSPTGAIHGSGEVPLASVKKREGKVEVTQKGDIRYMAIGRRKEAVARVWLIPGGSGEITVNDRPLRDYLGRPSLVERVVEPLKLAGVLPSFRVWATAKGGGLAGQADALRLGIARALVVWNEDLRLRFHDLGLLTRDPRAKERKKYGRKRARRGFQFRKR